MAVDRNRIVTLDSAGVATTVKDLNDLTNYYNAHKTFQVRPGAPKPMLAERQRRFGGSLTVGDTHDNGAISFESVVVGATAAAALDRAEEIFAILRAPRRDLYHEWRAASATNSTFYEIRGPASLTPAYDPQQFQGSLSWKVGVEIPVAPLAIVAPTTITISSTTMPATIALGTAIPGVTDGAPAVADVTLRTSGGTSAPIWAMIGWTERPTTPLASSVAPWGFIEAETGTSLSTWASAVDANYRGGNGLKATAAGAGTASALFALDPSTMEADDYSSGEIDIEVWGRFDLASTLVSPKVTLSLQPFAGTNFGGEQFSAEYGSVGKLLVKPSSGSAFRPVKLGTLSMPVDKATPLKWNMKVAASWAAGSTGNFGFDYSVLVPARQRALSPTAKPNDSAYPDFIASTSDTQKRIRGGDLSGLVASATGNFGRASGLGGSPIELPPGNVDMLFWLSSVVPDDPTSDTTSMQLSHTAVTGSVVAWPRRWLARGA